jgi:hypothetical protein
LKRWKQEIYEHLEELMFRKEVLQKKIDSGFTSSEDRARLEHIEQIIKINHVMIDMYLGQPPTKTLQ